MNSFTVVEYLSKNKNKHKKVKVCCENQVIKFQLDFLIKEFDELLLKT